MTTDITPMTTTEVHRLLSVTVHAALPPTTQRIFATLTVWGPIVTALESALEPMQCEHCGDKRGLFDHAIDCDAYQDIGIGAFSTMMAMVNPPGYKPMPTMQRGVTRQVTPEEMPHLTDENSET